LSPARKAQRRGHQGESPREERVLRVAEKLVSSRHDPPELAPRALLTACALGLVTSQHRARTLFSELEQEQERSRSSGSNTVSCSSKQARGGARTRRTHRQRQLHMRVPTRNASTSCGRRRRRNEFRASPVLALTLPTWRSRLLLYVFIACFAVLLGRAVYLQGLNNDFLQAKGESATAGLSKFRQTAAASLTATAKRSPSAPG